MDAEHENEAGVGIGLQFDQNETEKMVECDFEEDVVDEPLPPFSLLIFVTNFSRLKHPFFDAVFQKTVQTLTEKAPPHPNSTSKPKRDIQIQVTQIFIPTVAQLSRSRLSEMVEAKGITHILFWDESIIVHDAAPLIRSMMEDLPQSMVMCGVSEPTPPVNDAAVYNEIAKYLNRSIDETFGKMLQKPVLMSGIAEAMKFENVVASGVVRPCIDVRDIVIDNRRLRNFAVVKSYHSHNFIMVNAKNLGRIYAPNETFNFILDNNAGEANGAGETWCDLEHIVERVGITVWSCACKGKE